MNRMEKAKWVVGTTLFWWFVAFLTWLTLSVNRCCGQSSTGGAQVVSATNATPSVTVVAPPPTPVSPPPPPPPVPAPVTNDIAAAMTKLGNDVASAISSLTNSMSALARDQALSTRAISALADEIAVNRGDIATIRQRVEALESRPTPTQVVVRPVITPAPPPMPQPSPVAAAPAEVEISPVFINQVESAASTRGKVKIAPVFENRIGTVGGTAVHGGVPATAGLGEMVWGDPQPVAVHTTSSCGWGGRVITVVRSDGTISRMYTN